MSSSLENTQFSQQQDILSFYNQASVEDRQKIDTLEKSCSDLDFSAAIKDFSQINRLFRLANITAKGACSHSISNQIDKYESLIVKTYLDSHQFAKTSLDLLKNCKCIIILQGIEQPNNTDTIIAISKEKITQTAERISTLIKKTEELNKDIKSALEKLPNEINQKWKVTNATEMAPGSENFSLDEKGRLNITNFAIQQILPRLQNIKSIFERAKKAWEAESNITTDSKSIETSMWKWLAFSKTSFAKRESFYQLKAEADDITLLPSRVVEKLLSEIVPLQTAASVRPVLDPNCIEKAKPSVESQKLEKNEPKVNQPLNEQPLRPGRGSKSLISRFTSWVSNFFYWLVSCLTWRRV